ncbi:P-loop containing nucleoside triphosphate hydrolase protein [Mycena rebaudengoi]|nr:P-loop containing nucleoside triphosphate hydrolase protein [Mycena rebaudengoi]
MTTPHPTPLPGPQGTRSSPDWLANLILTAKTITAAAECLPFPYLRGALGPVIPILEAVQKMIKNRDDFEELCENIVSTMKVLQEKISHNNVNATTSLQQLCGELEQLLDEIRLKLGQVQESQKNRVLSCLKEFGKSAGIGDELSRYKTRLEKLRSDFISHLIEVPNEASVPVAQAPPPPVTTICPPPSCMFHGRRDILDKMHAYLSQDIGMRHVSLLHGLGGAGKTQICLKFLAESDKSRFTNVFFLDASTTDTINAGLKNIAQARSIGSEADDASRWLASSQDEWLLIFDNADDPSIDLFNYFPQSSRGNILITSRNPELSVHAPDSHHRISDMEEQDAVGLLLARAMQPLNTETENLARDIVKVFGLHILVLYFSHPSKALYCFPLAVVQAGAFIAKTGTMKKYLMLFEQNHTQLLSRVPSQSHDKYAWSVYTTWDISFKCLGPLAAKFLQICSFLHHEGISEAIFSNAARCKLYILGPTEEQVEEPLEFLNHFVTQAGSWDDLLFTDITAEIKGYSLINQDMNTNLFSIHPLVHDWSRNITDNDSTQECSATILAMATMSTLADQVFHIGLLPHLNSVLHREPQFAHKFAYPYERIYYDSGHFDRSQELCVALLENRKHTVGKEHPETLDAMLRLSVTYSRLGKLTDAEELQIVVLDKRKQILGPEHPDTLASMSELAGTYHNLGKLTDAEELKVVVLEKRKQILGTEHTDTLDAMLELAATYHGLGKLTDAKDIKEVVLEKRKQILGPEHPDTLDNMSSLATTLWKLGKLMDAKELDVAVLETRKQLFGTEHPETLAAMTNLAFTYRDLGKFPEAEHLLLTVLERKTSTLGKQDEGGLQGDYHKG